MRSDGRDGGQGAAQPEGRQAARDRARAIRARKADAWDGFFTAWSLALSGAVSSLAFLFQEELGLKFALFILFLAAALASGKKVPLATTILVSAGIVLANLLVPVGKVLWHAGPFLVTETSLLDGIDKALTFEGLICLSKASIRPGLRIPGRFGSIVGRAFVYYDRIVEYKGKIRAAALFEDIDALMLDVWDAPVPAQGISDGRRPGPARGHALAFGAAALSLAALAAGYFSAR